MTTSELRYPIIVLPHSGSGPFEVYPSETGLLRVTALAVKNQNFANTIVVDSSGCSYKVVSVNRVSKNKYIDFLDSLLNRLVPIAFQLTDECELLDGKGLGQRVRDCFQDEEFASLYADSGLTSDILDAFLNRPPSPSEIIAFLGRGNWDQGYTREE